MKSHKSDRKFDSIHESPIKKCWAFAGFLKVIVCSEAAVQMIYFE